MTTEFTLYRDPAVGLTASAAARADSLSPVFYDYATHQRLQLLEASDGTAGVAAAALTARLEDVVAGLVAYNAIPIAVNPTTTNTLTIGADVYEFVTAAGRVAADVNIGVPIGVNVAATMVKLVDAINAVYPGSVATGILKTVGTAAALKNGTVNVVAAYSGGVLRITAADAPGGDSVDGTTPNIACSDALTEVAAFIFANLNLSVGAASKPTQVARAAITITAAMISAGTVVVRVPVQSATMKVWAKAATALGVETGLGTDSVLVTAVPGSTTASVVTILLAGGAGQLADTNVLFVEVWA